MMTLERLHTDILYEILKFIPVKDIIRLQRVSKAFNEVIGRRIVWLNAYRLTTLPRPSGPHAWQDTDTLKRVLVRSAKVEVNWPCLDIESTSDVSPLHTTPEREARVYTPSCIRNFALPCGGPIALAAVGDRWIVFVTRSGIWCLDPDYTGTPVDSLEDHGQVVELYQCAANSSLQFSFTLNTTDREGRAITYVVSEMEMEMEMEQRKSILIFKLHLSTETGQDCVKAELKGTLPLGEATLFNAILGHGLLLIHAVALGFPHRFWLLHTKTDRIYKLKCAESRVADTSWLSLLLCSTHVLMIERRRTESSWECRIKAYPLPTLPAVAESNDSSNIPNVELHLSHAGIYTALALFTGPVLWECGNERDLYGHAGRIVLIAYRMGLPDPQVGYVAVADLILNSSFEGGVGTITCTLHDIFTPPTDPGSGSQHRPLPHVLTTKGGTESRGIIECRPGISRAGRRDTFGFTLSLDPGPGNAMQLSFRAGRLHLPNTPMLGLTLDFLGNIGRILRRYTAIGKEVLEVIDFA